MSDICARLRGIYSVGKNSGVIYEDRDFGNFTPQINKDAADLIEQQQEEIEALRSKIVTLGCDVLREADKIDVDLYEPRAWLALSVKNAQKLTKDNN